MSKQIRAQITFLSVFHCLPKWSEGFQKLPQPLGQTLGPGPCPGQGQAGLWKGSPCHVWGLWRGDIC